MAQGRGGGGSRCEGSLREKGLYWNVWGSSVSFFRSGKCKNSLLYVRRYNFPVRRFEWVEGEGQARLFRVAVFNAEEQPEVEISMERRRLLGASAKMMLLIVKGNQPRTPAWASKAASPEDHEDQLVVILRKSQTGLQSRIRGPGGEEGGFVRKHISAPPSYRTAGEGTLEGGRKKVLATGRT